MTWGIPGTTAWALRACERAGRGIRLNGTPEIYSYGGAIRLGDACCIASRPVRSHLIVGPEGVIDVHSGVCLGHGAAIAAFEHIEIQSSTTVGPFVIIMDTNFHSGAGSQSVTHECRPVVIGRNCQIGARVTLTRGVRIGDGARILAGSVVSSTIEAGACAAGARARVIGAAADPGTSWDGAYGLLPIVAMESMGLDAPPDLEATVAQLAQGNAGAVQRFSAAVAAAFSLRAAPASWTAGQRRLSEIARDIEQERHVR